MGGKPGPQEKEQNQDKKTKTKIVLCNFHAYVPAPEHHVGVGKEGYILALIGPWGELNGAM